MAGKIFAALFGVVFLLAGVSGFVPGLSPAHLEPGMTLTAGSRLALGLFPVNVLHNVIHIAFGLWGLAASRGMNATITYARAVAIIYGVLTVMGLIPLTRTTFGLVPIGGADIGLHLVLAVVAAYFGFLYRPRRPSGGHRTAV